MGEETKTAGQAAKQPPEPAKGKPAAAKSEPASSQPREYLVFREVQTSASSVGLAGDNTVTVLVELGTASARTAKEARRTVAKDKLDEAELRTDDGVPLRAITRTAAEAGRGRARLKVEPTWDD